MDRESLIRIIVEQVVTILSERGVISDNAGIQDNCPPCREAAAANPEPSSSFGCSGEEHFAFLKSPLPAIMALFCGGAFDEIDDVISQLKLIREKANLHLIYSHSFAERADTASIESALSPALVCRHSEVKTETLERIIPKYKALIVPTMSTNTLAKITSGLMDSAPTMVIFEALKRGLPTMVCREGVDPEWLSFSSQLARSAPASFRTVLYNNIEHLEQWGAQMFELDDLSNAVLNLLEPTRELLKKRRATGAAGGRIIITREDIEEMLKEGRHHLALSYGTIITHAAREFADDHSFRIDEPSTEL